MAVRASLRQPANAVPASNTNIHNTTRTAPVIDVPSSNVDESSAENLAAALEAGNTTADAVANGEHDGSQLPATVPNASVARRDSGISEFSGGALSGEFDESDLRFPTLKIVSGSGPLSKTFQSGTVVYGDEELLGPPDLKNPEKSPVLGFIPVQIHKQFRENLSEEESGNGVMPQVVDTLEEVHALGGVTQWIGDTRPSWGPSARCLFLLEQPVGNENPAFSMTLDGKNYAPAVMFITGGAYNVVKGFYNVLKTALLVPVTDSAGQPVRDSKTGLAQKRGLLWKCNWTMQVVRVPAGKYLPFRPLCRPLFKSETGAELRNYCESLISAGV